MNQKEIHEFRKEVDCLIGKASAEFEKLRKEYSEDKFREVRAIDKVEEHLINAKMWLGKVLEAKGFELPKEFRDNHKEVVKEERPIENRLKKIAISNLKKAGEEIDRTLFGEKDECKECPHKDKCLDLEKKGFFLTEEGFDDFMKEVIGEEKEEIVQGFDISTPVGFKIDISKVNLKRIKDVVEEEFKKGEVKK